MTGAQNNLSATACELLFLMVGDKDNPANVSSNKLLSCVWPRLILSDEHAVTETMGVGGFARHLELTVLAIKVPTFLP